MTETRCDFTLRHYREIIEQATGLGFKFLRLRDTATSRPEGRQIVLRHDIDFSVDDAYRMATLERDWGVVATYCVLLHSPTYSLGEIATVRKLTEIMGMGHEIALHYDVRFFELIGMPTLEGVAKEAGILGRLLGTTIESVAQHQPGSGPRASVAGSPFIDAYDDRLTRDIKYLSESRQHWREGCVHEHLGRPDPMQVLIHPEWWEAGVAASRRAAVARLVSSRQAEIAATMAEYAESMERAPGP